MIKFTASKYETTLITKIAQRAVAMAEANGVPYPYKDAVMDIESTHCNGTPIRLHELLAANDGDFGHDIFAIRKLIDRTTGKLPGYFAPRYSL